MAQFQTDWAQAKMGGFSTWLPQVFLMDDPEKKNKFIHYLSSLQGEIDHYNNPAKEARPDWMDRV